MFFFTPRHKTPLPSAEQALPGREAEMPTPATHFVLHTPLKPPAEGVQTVMFGMGCFWGAERKFWTLPGVVTTAVGYAAGHTKNPTYKEVCSGRTAHNEVVLVAWDPEKTSLGALLKTFWESHNPTQGMRQGNDTGTQYRSGIYVSTPEQKAAAEASRVAFQEQLTAAGYGVITTEIRDDAGPMYYAEAYHQ
ncbi:MAG: peptide-methionine (S)-S-oxide reductase MsrA, partial [Myxococcota bacterium]|nr:peptide-methionine (S)-S-oxide reductase MsrA [Myxococcota bacterium]